MPRKTWASRGVLLFYKYQLFLLSLCVFWQDLDIMWGWGFKYDNISGLECSVWLVIF